jgi:hypothetical protein
MCSREVVCFQRLTNWIFKYYLQRMTDPTSRQRGRRKKTRQQISENNIRTESNIWSQVPEWARYLDIITDWPRVVIWLWLDRLCGLVVRVPGYRSRGPWFDYRRYQIFWEMVWNGVHSLVSTTEELLGRNSCGSGLERRECGRRDPSH